ncbi:sigma-70 family RNA polymerase sigma factor [Neobacillus terrae]|uniref:sigma-70 family RNA polymerase sigma factor n=1 Tax=Neobacillus terrae TaxID=3034837 RepID=UPI00140B0BC1|nr:sigma-70 family RNA polymerase sigma factor [Neobacillus terrae]NHM33834.1 sigma-70 family RNA polymerase sigma factor [Neobacillus terrae]
MRDNDTILELMDSYGTSILHLAYSFVRNRATAEDLSQEIFLKCYEKLNTFKGDSTIQTWLYRIAVNHCKDYVKSWHYRKVFASEYISKMKKGQENATEIQFIQKTDRAELFDDILRLPVKYKEVIILAYFNELTMNEIGLVYGINVNTVKSRISKAKKILKGFIEERSAENGRSFEETKGRIG